MPQQWSQPYPHSAPPNSNHPRPLAAQYPHDPHDPYAAPALYPTAVTQQMPHRYSQPAPLPGALVPGLPRPRTRSTIGDNGVYFEPLPPVPQFPFPSPSPAQFTASPSLPRIPVPPSKPPALQPRLSGYPPPVTSQTRDELPIRPAPMSARRSSSSPAINRISDLPRPPVPPLPPQLYPGYPQHAPQHAHPPPTLPPSIPIPSPYRSDSSPFYASPFEAIPPPSHLPPPRRASSPPRVLTSSPPKFENDRKRVPGSKEEEELKRVLALSERESKEQSGKVSKEEEEFAKAIEESIRYASNFGMPIPGTGNEAGPSRLLSNASPLSYATPSPVSESPVSSPMPHASPHTPYLSASRPTSKVSSPLLRPTQPSIDDDEAFAQRLAEEEERAVSGSSQPKPGPPPTPPYNKLETTTPAPAPAPSPGPASNSGKHRDMKRPRLSVVGSEPPPPLYHHAIGSAQTTVPTKTSPTSQNNGSSLGRSSSASAVSPSSTRPSPVPAVDDKPNGGRSQSWDAVPSTSNSARLSPTVPAKSNSLQTVEESLNPPDLLNPPDSPLAPSPSSSSGPVTLAPTANSFIDQKLLDGVCKSSASEYVLFVILTLFVALGFNGPQISAIKTTLKGGVPNVISLPAGRFVPFHIQAPDWRHLLKMMARLSGTRIEASIEAMAGTKQEMKLRTIVQFVRVSIKSPHDACVVNVLMKVNTTSQDWRTVIYLTIDNPPPTNAPHKFTNGDVNTLPFSYSASPLPTLLRDGPDGPMSKYYTVPATPSTPYPTLPISFPNMAMYLASAVEDSRRMGHDNSSGMKRLAKTLDTLYPATVELGMEDDEPDKPAGGVMNMFKNVFGRGRRDQRRNDDNYADLVTPFVPEWG